MTQKTAFIIPTYNEAENITNLIKQILNLKKRIHIIVIDDNSPDGTADLLKDKLFKNRVTVIKRPKKMGLGGAYIAGFKYAIGEGFEYIGTMDADMSHPPKYIPSMLNKIRNSNMVIGSRYVKGGQIKGFGWERQLLSRSAQFLCHKLLNLQIFDSTSGFRLYRKNTLKKINFANIKSQGYSYLIESAIKVKKSNLKIVEVPITFINRKKGRSKVSDLEILNALKTVLYYYANKAV